MAEQGTATEKKDEQKDGEEVSDTTSVFMDELTRQFEKSDAAKGKKEVPIDPNAKPSGSDASASPEVAAGQEKPKETPAAPALSAEDEALLKEWGIPTAEATPAVRAALKKEHDRISEIEKRATDAEGRAKQSSSQNKQVSEMYQKLKKENKVLLDRMATDPQNVMEFADKLFSPEELDKLPPEAKEILGDKGARLAFTLLVTKMAQIGQQQMSQTGDDKLTDGLETSAPEEKKPAGDQPPAPTAEQIAARDAFIDKKMAELGFSNYKEIFASPEWVEYLKPVIDGEIKSMTELHQLIGLPIPEQPALIAPTYQKLKIGNPFLTAEVLRGFNQFKTAKAESQKADQERQQHAAGLEGHGDTKPKPQQAGKTMGELSPEEIQMLPSSEFTRLARDKSAKTTLYG